VHDAALIIASFFLGAVPFGVLVNRALGGPDLRTIGSGNIGATNVTRALGRKAGFITALLDITKGLIPVLVGKNLGLDTLSLSLVAAAALLGHCYSPYLGFRGGKGVAVGFGVCLALAPIPAMAALFVWTLSWLMLGVVSVASMAAAAALIPACWLLPQTRPYLPITLFVLLVIVWRHRDNIGRLRRGSEF